MECPDDVQSWSPMKLSGHRYDPLPNEGTPCHRVCWGATWTSVSFVTSVSALALMALGMLLRPASLVTKIPSMLSVPNGSKGDEIGDKAMSVRVQSSYISEDKVELYPWEHMAEPYKKAVFQVLSWPSELLREDDDVEFRWKVFNVDVGTGTSVEYTFESLGAYERVPSAVGQQVYGKRYYSKDYFNRLHIYYGGDKDCDHWHDSAGFVTSHVAISLMFEQTLQAVDPSIALPYWDFTIEGTKYDWTNFRSSSVFSDDWFGTAAPRNVLRTPDRGRFAYVPTMVDAREYSEMYNAYGLLRSPWNTDPNPIVTRHDHIFGYPNNLKPSGCKQYRDAVHKASWMDLTQSMNGGGHGHIHELMGGTWSADWHGFSEKTTEKVFPFKHKIVHYMKYLWRSGHLECPKSCAMDVPWRDCQCTCASLEAVSKTPAQVVEIKALEEAGLLEQSAAVFFYDKNMKLISNLGNEQDRAFTAIPGYTEDETAGIYLELLSTLCTPMKIGSHYEATSTNDVTFWVLHPTFDRLWHLRRLENDSNFDETWRDDNDCYGHNPDDLQPFFGLFDTDPEETERSFQVPKKYHTNAELYDLLQPDGMAIPYIYDDFEWPHCNALGIFINGRREDEGKHH